MEGLDTKRRKLTEDQQSNEEAIELCIRRLVHKLRNVPEDFPLYPANVAMVEALKSGNIQIMYLAMLKLTKYFNLAENQHWQVWDMICDEVRNHTVQGR